MLDRDDRRVAFAGEESLVALHHIFVDAGGELLALGHQRLELPLQSFTFLSEIVELAIDRFARGRGGFFLNGNLGPKFVSLFHQLELLVFELHDLFLVALDLMAHGLELVVLARLVLLRLQARDAALPRADIELQFFAIDLELFRALLERFEADGGGDELRFKILALLRQYPDLGLDMTDTLIAILQNEQLFQLSLHARTLSAGAKCVNGALFLRERRNMDFLNFSGGHRR